MKERGWYEVKAQVPASFEHFEEHPRYGRGPRYTGLNPGASDHGSWRLSSEKAIFVPGTGVVADLAKQSFSCVATTIYMDEIRSCRVCGQKFLFFAEEQKHWYEELGFTLDADCVDCLKCRKADQAKRVLFGRYQELWENPTRSVEESIEFTEAGTRLVEAGLGKERMAEKVRMVLNRLPEEIRESEATHSLRGRLETALGESA